MSSCYERCTRSPNLRGIIRLKSVWDTKSLAVNDQRTLEDQKEDIVNMMLKARVPQMTIVS